MSNLPQKVVSDDFMARHVTDGVYRKIVRELSSAEDKKGRGRKIELTAEKLHNFFFYLSVGTSYKNATISAQIAKSTRQKYMSHSEEFRRVTSLAKGNVTLLALVSIHDAIAGRKMGYYCFIHPVTKEPTYLFLKEINPNIRAAKWWLEKMDILRREEKKNKQIN